LNWYVYCEDNPVNYVDYTGFASSTRYVNGTNVNMRSGAGLSCKSLFKLQNNTPVEYLNRKVARDGYNWANVRYNGKNGWIADQYLKSAQTPSGSSNNGTGSTRYINGNNVNMRAGPGTSYKVLATLSNNASVQYLNQKIKGGVYNWAKVQYNGKTGWIADIYLKMKKTPSLSPIVDEMAKKFGFGYDAGGDYFFAQENGWQRTFGYMDLFDRLMNDVPGIDILALNCPFYYNKKGWRVECWKGEYGLTAGGEVGVYIYDSSMTLSGYAKRMQCEGAIASTTGVYESLSQAIKKYEKNHKNEVHDWYRSAQAGKGEYLHIDMKFYKISKNWWGVESTEKNAFAARSGTHWWLTVFKLKNVDKEDIRMDVTLTFLDSKMRDAYNAELDNRIKIGYNVMNKVYLSNNRIFFKWR